MTNRSSSWRFNTSNVCGSNLPVGARWEEASELGWQQPIVHFVFQSEELAERAHLAFGFTNTSAPFSVTSERVGAEYQVKFRYVGEAVFQPDQQLVVYYNGAPAGWLWILPYLVSGKIKWFSLSDSTKWQIQNPVVKALVEGGTIPGLPLSTSDNEGSDALEITIEQSYAEWNGDAIVDLEYRCVDGHGSYVTKTFFTADVKEIEAGGDELLIFVHGRWYDWFADWDIEEVLGLAGTLDEIIWGDNKIQMSFDVGN